MPDALTLIVAISYLSLLAWQLNLKWRVIRNFRAPLPSLMEDSECPQALVVLCLRGGDPFLKHSIGLLIQQDYPRYQVRIVVDSPDDEAHGILREVFGESLPPQIEVLNLTHRYPNCSLKISGLLQATQNLPEGTKVVAVMDGDAVPHRGWLRELATPIVREGAALSTGVRWYAPHRSTLGSLCRFWWNASATPMLLWYQIPWGGSMAVRSDLFLNEELRSRLQLAFGEDCAFSQYALDHGERIVYPPSLVIVNHEEIGVRDFCRFNVRQLISTRVCHHSWPWLVLYSLISSLAMTYPLWRFMGLPVSGLADIVFTLYCFAMWGGELAQAAAFRRVLATRNETITGWNEWGRWVDSLLAVIVLPYLHLGAVLHASTLHRVCWRGVWYRVGGRPVLQVQRDEWAERASR